MMRKSIYFALGAVLVAYATAAGQNLNPRVEVTNIYQGRVTEVHKTDIPMSVPDTLYDFDYTVDYSVFDNPYKGSYEFRPYLIDMKPEATPSSANSLHLEAGAGYPLTPLLNGVWSPRTKGKLGLSVWGGADGYYGQMGYDDNWSDGSLLKAAAGISGTADFASNVLRFSAGYGHIGSDDSLSVHNYNSFCANLSLSTDVPTRKGVEYDINLDFTKGMDRFDACVMDQAARADETGGGVEVKLLFPVGRLKKGSAGLDFGGRILSMTGGEYDTQTVLFLAPRYRLSGRRGRLEAGARLGFCGGIGIYPVLKADWFLVPEYSDVYVDVVGGERINSISSILALNPFCVTPDYRCGTDRLAARAGLRGNVASVVSYDFHAGYSICDNALRQTVGGISYIDYTALTAGGEIAFANDRFSLDLKGEYCKARDDNEALELNPAILSLPEIQASASAEYNWNRRIFASVCCSYCSELSYALSEELPSWIDLGIRGEYRINSKLSVWLNCGNVLAQDVQRYAHHSLRGPLFRAGVCLNLQ